MYGQQVGGLEQPLENVVVEEIERANGLREVHFTIAMRDLSSTAPIAQSVADLAAATVGVLHVEEPGERSLSFPTPFENYMAKVRAAKPGEVVQLIDSPMLIGGYFCIGCNINEIRGEKTPEFYYLLTMNFQAEELCSASMFKKIYPLALGPNVNNQGIMAYRIKGTKDDSEKVSRMKNGILEAAVQNAQNRAPLTLNQIAVMTEALLEVDYHTHSALKESSEQQRVAVGPIFFGGEPIQC